MPTRTGADVLSADGQIAGIDGGWLWQAGATQVGTKSPSRHRKRRHQGELLNAQDSSVYDLAAKWVDRNCLKATRHQFLRAVEQALKANTNIGMAVGADLSKTEQSWLVCVYSRHFFAFALTGRQAANLDVQSNGLLVGEFEHSLPSPLVASYPLSANRLEIDSDQDIDPFAPIRANLHYDVLTAITEPVAVTLEFSLKAGASTMLLALPAFPLGGSGVIELQFPPINKPNTPIENSWQGTTVAFSRFVTKHNPERPQDIRPLSNPLGILLSSRSA